MKVTIRNLGVIKEEATIDLKPLTILIGPNNAGKTWLAYALAGILGPYGSSEYIEAYTEERVPRIYKPLDDAVERVLIEGSATIDLSQFVEDYGEVYFDEVAKYAQVWMGEFLSTQYARFDDLNISLQLAENKTYLLQRILRFQRTSSVAKGLLTIQKTRNDSKVYAYTVVEGQDIKEQEEELGEKIPIEEVRRRLVSFVLTALQQALYTSVRIFPTERTTLVATRFSERVTNEEQLQKIVKFTEALSILAKELDITELPTSRVASSMMIRPVNSFLSMLNSLFRVGTRQIKTRQKQAENEPKVRQYIELADVLEKQILAGDVRFSTLEPDPKREILFHPMEDVNLEIPIASSMVKELSPLVLYLRYLAQPGELLIIDEPEMNLHPEAQAKMIEFLAMLVNAGLTVLFTTHSPYITDHLTNLIKANECEDKECIRTEFFLQRNEAFLAQEKVSVYGVSDGTVRNILDEDGIINWNTFGNISERISNIFFKL